MRLLFAGTPEVALPSLRALLDSHHEVVGVLTRADAPSGRGRRLTPSPVKQLAQEAGLPVLTPTTLRDAEVLAALRDLAPDAAAVVAYGALVPPAALALPERGWVNLHFSLLPALRGAAPAQRAVLSGARRTGLSVFQLEEGLDTGDVLATASTPIGEHETAGELLDRLAEQGAPVLLGALDALEAGTADPVPQDHDLATRAPKLSTAEARIDWSRPAEQVGALIRGMSPHPGAWTLLDGERSKILGTEAIAPGSAPPGRLPPGRIVATKKQVLVGTGTAPIAISRIAPAGRTAMRAADWARGASLRATAAFAAPEPEPEPEHHGTTPDGDRS